MKVFLRVLVVTLVTSTIGLAGYTKEQSNYPSQLAQRQGVPVEAAVPVSLPTVATLMLKDGNSRSGQMIAFDVRSQQLTIEAGGSRASVQINQIQRITFRRNTPTYRSNGSPIRGEDSTLTMSRQKTWHGIPLNAFTLQDSRKGLASVNLSSVVDRAQLRGIRDVASNSDFVVDEITFESQGTTRTMTIKATPVAR